MERVYQKVGRTAMPRSIKKKIKREMNVQVEDEESKDRRKYLGEIEPL